MDHYGIPRQVDSQVWWSDQPPNCPLMMVMMMPCMILAMVAGIDLRVLRAFPILDSPCWNNFGNPFSCESLITITSEGCERSASGNLLRHFAECRDGSTSIAPSWQVRHYNGPEWKDLKDLGILVMLQLWQNVGCFHLNIWYNRNRIWSKRICRKLTVSWDYVSEKHVGFVWNIETWGLRFFAALLEYHNLNFGSLIPFAGMEVMEVTYNSPNRCRIAAKLWHFQSFAEWSRCSFPLPNWDLTNLAPGVPLPPSHHDFQLPEDVFHTKTNKLIPTNHMATSQLMAFNFSNHLSPLGKSWERVTAPE